MRVPAAAILAIATFGCAATLSLHIREETQVFVHRLPLKKAWPEARALLLEAGYAMPETDDSLGWTMETEWRVDDSDGPIKSRYLVQGIPVTLRSCRIHITRAVHTQSGGDRSIDARRDLDMEWKLIERLAPERAAGIRADAER